MPNTAKPYPNYEEIPEWFTHSQPPTPEQAEKYMVIHNQARALAEFAAKTLPVDQPETAFALQKIEEFVYWAVTSISRGM